MNEKTENAINNEQPHTRGDKPLDEKKVCEDKLKAVQKKLQKKDTQKFKSKYFEYYDDIKISDRQDW